jgi:predicted site-specific integrase-resolvase
VIGYREIAELTGVKESTLKVWKYRGKLPPPDLEPYSRAPLWKRETIVKWDKERKK